MAREEARLHTMEDYIWRRHNTIAQYIATRSLLDLYEGTYRAPGERVGMRWWDQAGINMVGARESTAATVEAEEDKVDE